MKQNLICKMNSKEHCILLVIQSLVPSEMWQLLTDARH